MQFISFDNIHFTHAVAMIWPIYEVFLPPASHPMPSTPVGQKEEMPSGQRSQSVTKLHITHLQSKAIALIRFAYPHIYLNTH